MLLAEWGDLEMHRAGFDLTYAWDSYDRLKAVWQGAPASSFVQGELPDMKAMPPGGMRMRFSTNHDKTAWEDPPVKIFGPAAGARAAFVAVALLPGRPLLYNGQEVESPQKLRPVRARPHPVESAAGEPRPEHFTPKLSGWRGPSPRCSSPDLRPIETSAPKDVIAYRRGDLVVLVNARPRAVSFTVTGFDVDGARDLLSKNTQRGDTISLPAHGPLVLKKP